MARGLHGVGVEGDALFAAERADLGDGLHRADLVVGEHHRDEAGVGADRGLDVFEADNAVGVGAGRGDDGLVVGLAAAGGEIDLARQGVDALRHGLARFLDRLLRPLTEGIETGGVAVILQQIGEHRVESGAADAGGGCVVSVNKHNRSPFCIVILYSFFHLSPVSRSRSVTVSR